MDEADQLVSMKRAEAKSLLAKLKPDVPLVSAMLAYSPSLDGPGFITGAAEVFEHPDCDRASDKYTYTVGACFSDWREYDDDRRLLRLFIDFHHCVVRDGMEPEVLHRALSVIPEYRAVMAADVPSAS